MMSWIDWPHKIRWHEMQVPGYVHLVDETTTSVLESALVGLGFEVFSLRGEAIFDRASLFDALAALFDFPEYFGRNWDAFDECFREFCLGRTSPVAILWLSADQTAVNCLQAFEDSVAVLSQTGRGEGLAGSPHLQVETFFLGPSRLGYMARAEGLVSLT